MDNATLTQQMVQAGFRCSIITVHTDHTSKQVNRLRKQIGVEYKGASGPLPSGACLLSNSGQVVEATLFMCAYLRAAKNPFVDVDVQAVMAAYRVYTGYRSAGEVALATSTEPLHIDRAWVIAREYRSKEIVVRICSSRRCRLPYLVSSSMGHRSSCPFCSAVAERDRFHCDVNDAVLTERPVAELLELAARVQDLAGWGLADHEVVKELGLSNVEFLATRRLNAYGEPARQAIAKRYSTGSALVRALTRSNRGVAERRLA